MPADLFPSAPDAPLACWVVSDGRAGIENQALGLAEAVARVLPLAISVKRLAVRPPWARLPRALWGDPFARLDPEKGDRLAPPYPALWIGCGRRATPFTMAAKRASPATFTVQIQNPRAPLAAFDLVVPPRHDGLAGENVFALTGSPGRLTREGIEAAAARLAPHLRDLPRPRVAVLIGGENRAYRMGRARTERLAADLARLARDGAGLMITPSRRTDPATLARLRAALDGHAHFIWDGRALGDPAGDIDNPYAGMLGLADHVLVTADSVNMAADAAITGKPVSIIPLDEKRFTSARKFDAFHRALSEHGAARPFEGALESWTYVPLDETNRAAAEVVRRLKIFPTP